jgi:hypothetical protein
MSNDVIAREALIKRLAAEHELSADDAASLVAMMETLIDLEDTEREILLRTLRGKSVQTPLVRTLALKNLVRLDEEPIELPLAASSVRRERASLVKPVGVVRPVFEHAPDGLRLFDGPDGTICIEEHLHIDLIQIGPLWGRVRSSRIDGYSVVSDISYGALRDLWEQEHRQ